MRKQYSMIRVRTCTLERIREAIDSIVEATANGETQHYGEPIDNNNADYRGLTIDRFITQLLDARDLLKARQDRAKQKAKEKKRGERNG